MENNKTKIIAVGGPTASGKSALALSLAEALDGEIISCDSMQIYRGMDIGTAKPTAEEMARVPHHMIDVCDPRVNYSAADWAEGAARAIADVTSRGRLPIICGGTGMYLDALLRPTSFSEGTTASDTSEEFRSEMQEYALRHGNAALHERLREIDPESADAIHMNNVKRVIRALEIYHTTGITKTEADRMTTVGESPYDCRVITLDYENRGILYDRIDRRVDVMIADGLESEIRSLLDTGALIRETTAAQAIGYKEMLLYTDGILSLADAAELIKKNTRNYAKRQITWFKRYQDISVVPDRGGAMKTLSKLTREAVDKLSTR
ncbi:MAG: tRNA (adenosine(37)-N6)-dimethylallyltransferase MiaA [Clostridia bacterium]|nr:tRNA (adenosine(37)-N6)-dimethylallyltransferase MiaA [Clostridia bacterium]